jgi:hypothetical protein
MSSLDYYFYNKIYVYKLRIPELSRYRLKIEFLFLNYYTDYEKRFKVGSDILVLQNTKMELLSYLFASKEIFDLKNKFDLKI